MKPLGTIVLLATSLVLWAVIWWIDRSPEGSDAGTPGTGGSGSGIALLRLEPETIGRLRISHPEGDVVAEKRDGYWHLTEPEADRADPETMDTLLDLLCHLTVLERIPAEEIGSTAELRPETLGLAGESSIRVEMTPTSDPDSGELLGDPEVLLLGNPSPLANSLYVQVADDPKRPDIYIVDGNPRQYLESPVASLRDRHLFLAPAEQIVQVIVKSPEGEIEVNRKVTPPISDWTMTRPLETRANRDRVDQLLASLSALRVESVIRSGQLPSAPPHPLPEGSLVIELRRYGLEEPLVVMLSPTDDDDAAPEPGLPLPVVEARVSDRPAVFRLRTDLLESLPSSPDSYRDPNLARIPLQTVFGIGIESRGDPPVELKTARIPDGVAWYSSRNGTQEPANVSQVINLIQALNEEQILSFASDSSAELADYNLKPAPLKITVSHYERIPETAPDGAPEGSGGQVGATRKVLQLGFQEIEGDVEGRYRMFANWAGEPYIYEISPAFREKVPTHPLKWKDPRLLTFNPISLREIERQESDSPKVRLTYDYRRDAWEALRGEDRDPVTEELNKISARRLLETLGSLTASSWMIPSAQAFQALQEPDATFKVTLETVDRATGKVVRKTHTLELAKTSAAIYYGRLDGSPEVFVIDRNTYRDLIIPLFGDLVRPPRG